MTLMQSFSPTSIEQYKALARTWAATVTVVTVRRTEAAIAAGEAELDGFTATAFFTVSMAPPIIAVSATSTSSALAMLRDARGFVVNLLAPDQHEVAGAFARPAVERVGLWEQLPWTGDLAGAPLLHGTTGAFSAGIRQLVDAGDHTLVLGDVTALHLGEGSDTLVYHNRGYGRVTRM
jgi:flavin reductase (DIM6/NTAB) family NADH-FMN oxidoreductase RutF